MVQLFTDVGPMLIQYREALREGRHTMMQDKIAELKMYSGQIIHKKQAKTLYKTLAYMATFINYADVIQRIENQQYFDILLDFYGMEMDEELSFWFEFGNTPGQMRLKQPLQEYTPEIWEKFRMAQKKHLTKTNKTHLFNLDQLDIYHPPANQLYPVQIQMGGKLENEAVDRINIDALGRIRFAQHHGFYILPGGGMIEITNAAKIDDLERKMLEEHLEEEHANLYIKAAELYEQLNPDDFAAALIKACSSKQAQSLSSELRSWLQKQVSTKQSNAICLQKIVTELDRQIEVAKKNMHGFSEKYTQEEHVENLHMLKSLIELRAIVQVQPFELTPLFAAAFEYIKRHTICVDIQQYLDTRVLGGSQLSHSFIMRGVPLEDWFSAKFNGIGGEFGDDISGSAIAHMTLLEALSKFRKIKFSHILIALAAYEECLDNGTLRVENIWSEVQFEHARQIMLAEASKFLTM
ncbi:hypothetical protein OQJ19_12275 [Fluoribacter gormanii]|uniref:Uncharacterized protein n=1 Tax=Fluoribacter gormanii TaxID=464 RepID=A0A377GKY1_9GAMM|nr:hypothetical protein [Fluoribacter gormanii]KTD01763.1 hypothetical protein Lgor_2140 [Fluoribacter gormanii]MCW8471416.1 hypothetical protein [Fluoribacter gormanii]SIR19928.1 hypothetical protein SAMN05421777_1087 [Fluoribacter gormanii]STO25467.1 Uncharacterised protein [Fluoribacter gormanii]